jgi:starch phosphorylase
VFLGELEPDSVTVELYADALQGAQPLRQAMERERLVQGASGADAGYIYGTAVAANLPAADFTPRLIPHINGAAVPLEESHILWQR